MCIPAVNIDECLEETNLNMVTCGGQASIPLAYAIASVNPNIEYIETIKEYFLNKCEDRNLNINYLKYVTKSLIFGTFHSLNNNDPKIEIWKLIKNII